MIKHFNSDSPLIKFAKKRVNLSLQRRFSDRGDAILVMAIILIPFFFLASGFAMDLTKATYVKQQFQTMAQESTTEAARNINQIGAIKPEGVNDAIDTYNEKYKGQRGETMGGTFGGHGVCDKVDTPDGKKTAPYMIISLDGGRNNDGIDPVTWNSEAGSKPVLDNPASGEYDSNLTYYSIRATIYDSSPNIILGMFGKPCQSLTPKTASISFGSNDDLEDPNTKNAPPPDSSSVKFCHRTNSNSNPYTKIKSSEVGKIGKGHTKKHTGPVWNSTLESQGKKWGDIIEPYVYGGVEYPGYNWTSEGKKILNNGCNAF